LYQDLLRDARFFSVLFDLDVDLAERARGEGCGCGGMLHRAHYDRKPRGAAVTVGQTVRFSFCCAVEGCRRRATPASFRFLGRKVYLATVVLLVSALRDGATPDRRRRLREVCGADARTLRRWRRWWQQAFANARCWRGLRGRWARPPADSTLPGALLDSLPLEWDLERRVVGVLWLLSPITTGAGLTEQAA
jgi:hypothetical protein